MRRYFRTLSIGAVAAIAASAVGQATPVSDLIMYGIDDDTHELLRYDFNSDSFISLGPVHLSNGQVLTEIESLAFIPGRNYLFGVWNYDGASQSKLVRINLFTAEATPFGGDTGFGNVEGLTHVAKLSTGPGPLSPTSVILRDSKGVDAFEVSFVDIVYNPDGTSSWTYHVRELDSGKDLSHWNLGLAEAHRVMPGTTSGYEVGIDGSTGFYGIKWDVGDGFISGDFTIVLDKKYGGTEGGNGIGVLAKGGNAPDVGEIFGPTENVPEGGHTLYAVHSDVSGNHGLISISPDTGIGQLEMTLSRKYECLARSHDGKLFGLCDSVLYRIDPYSDVEEMIGSQLFRDVEGLEFAFGIESPAISIPGVPASMTEHGAMFGFSDENNTLIVFDSETGQSQSYHCAVNTTDVEGLVFITTKRDVWENVLSAAFD